MDVLRILPPLPDSKEEDTAHQTLLKNLLESESVSEDLFSRIPEEWLWDIHMAHVPKVDHLPNFQKSVSNAWKI